MHDSDQRAEEEEEREGAASGDEHDERDGMHSGFTSPQERRGTGGDKAGRGSASRGTAPPRALRQIGGIAPQRWGRGSREEVGAPKRKRGEHRERAGNELTSRLAASLSATSQAERQMDGAQAAASADVDDREWDSAGGSASGGDSEGGGQESAAKRGAHGKRRRITQLDPPQSKDDSLREVISSRMIARPNWRRQGGFASLMQEITPGMNASDAPSVDELLLVAESSVEFLFGTSRAALLQISSPLSTTESKAWLSSQNVDAKLAKLGRSMPQALKNTLYFYSFQKPCEELLRKATLDPAEAADWAYYSGRWYLADASDHCVTKAEFVAVQASARTLLQQLDAAQAISNSSPAPAMPFGLAVDGRKLMSRFFQLRGGWVQEVASAAAAVVVDAEIQADVKIIGRAYALQAAQFDSFYPRFVEALDAASRGQSGTWEAAKFLADSHFKFFAAFAKGLLGGVQSGPAMAVAPVGAAAYGAAASAPWAAAQYSAASTGQLGAVPAIHASPTHGGLLGPGGAPQHAQHPAQTQQTGAALWSTIPPLPNQSGGLALSAVAPAPPDAARAALYLSQLAAMPQAQQAATLQPLTIPPPAYVAPRAEGAPARQHRSPAQAAAATSRNDVWIPYSPSTLGSHSPYPQLRPPETCFECNAPNSHAANECPVRFARIFGAPPPGWTREGKKDATAWTGDGAAMLQPTREALAKYLKDHGVPAHRHWPVSTTEIAAPQPPERRGRAT